MKKVKLSAPTMIINNCQQAMTLLLSATLLYITNPLVHASSSIQCDYSRFTGGCYNSANLQCDTDTFTCRCIQGMVMIDDKFCVERVKFNKPCKYDAQCDNHHGFYCLAVSPSRTLIECPIVPALSHEIRCRCLNASGESYQQSIHQSDNRESPSVSEQSVAHKQYSPARPFHFLHPHQRDQPNKLNSNASSYHYHATNSILNKPIWVFLIVILFGLIALLLLIKYQAFRTTERSFHRADDRLSINTEPDVPPPYEVAIRMKNRPLSSTLIGGRNHHHSRMLSRNKDLVSKKEIPNDASEQSTSSSCTSKISHAKGEKRKAKHVDPHDEKGSEYLRRKHNFIKSSIRVDYQPDICKDYKETGFCGFGDSCKFLHDRSDYKHGWQLEQEWSKGLHKDEDDDKYLVKDDDDKTGGDDPTICIICKEAYKDPVVTKCKHQFCGECAEKECNDICYICDKPTSGIFKVAKPNQDRKIET